MYIESGQLKGRKLIQQKSGLRPTTSKVKAALFNMVRPELVGKNFLDCFAGTGMIGFEALSLGAKNVGFVELNREAIKLLFQNTQKLGLDDSVQIKHMDVIQFLLSTKENWDILFFSPPYDTVHWYQLLRSLEQSPVLKQDGMAIIQHPSRINLDTQILDRYNVRKYGFNSLSFFKKRGVV